MSEHSRQENTSGGGASGSAATDRSAGKRTLSERRYSARAPAAGRPDGVIQRSEITGSPPPRSNACLDPEGVLADLRRIATEAGLVERLVDPDGAGAGGVVVPSRFTARLRRLTGQLDNLAPAIDGCGIPLVHAELERERATTTDAILAAFQVLALYHADQTLQAWSNATPEDQETQRTRYHQESGRMPDDADWCGMFANAQYRAAGMSGALNMTFNSTFHVQEFFTYGDGSNNSPTEIQAHGQGDPMALRAYHEQRASLRSWLAGAAIGDDVRPGDVVTLDWIGSEAGADHICIVRSYAADTGTLTTIDGNAYGARKPGAANPAFDDLDPADGDMAALASATSSDVSTNQYQTGAGAGRTARDGTGPAFNRDAMLEGNTADVWKAMTLTGRGRPSLVDFETDHVYPNFTGRNAEQTTPPGGPIQRLERAALVTDDPVAAFAAATEGAAAELPYRAEMQAHFHADFSGVQAFTGRDLSALGAHAATRDDTVAFASATPDKETVAHELTHVLQSRAGTAGTATMSDPGDASEREAREVASAITAGDARDGGLAAGDARDGGLAVGAAPSAAIHRQDGPEPVPPMVQPPTADGHQSGRLDWDEYYGIDMTPDGSASFNSIREIYDYYLLGQLRAQFPTEFAEYAGALPDDDARNRAAVDARHAAVVRLGNAMRNAMLALQRAGDTAGAEAMRVRLFAANQHAVVEALQAESSTRYRKLNADTTWCNVYAYDVVTALGGYLPRIWWRDTAVAAIRAGAQIVSPAEYTRRRAAQPEGDLGVVANNEVFTEQVDANKMARWMIEFGDPQFGWTRVGSARQAQATANRGRIVIILAGREDTTQSGHVSVVLAETEQHQHPTETAGNVYVPLQSQAGADNFETNDTDAAVGTAGRRAWWNEPGNVDAGFWAFQGVPQAGLAIQAPDRLGTVAPQDPNRPQLTAE